MEATIADTVALCPKCSSSELKPIHRTTQPAPEYELNCRERSTTGYECRRCGAVFVEAR